MLDKLKENARTGLDGSPGDPVAAWAVTHIEKLEQAARDAHSAISTLDKAELGYAERDGYQWPIRDELLSNLQNALKA